MNKIIKSINKFFKYMIWLEDQRMKSAIKSGSFGPLL